MNSTANCPCERFIHPRTISNPPGRTFVDYRVGDYVAFRHALLRARPGEVALADWHPTGEGDLALQMLEWWAYLADVLTFYNERAIQEMLLRTAVLPEDVRRIIRLLGYRPRPGIAATGVVAALTDSSLPFVLPRGLPIEGVSAPGQPAQIFELDEDIEIGELGQPLPVSARLPPSIKNIVSGHPKKIRAPRDKTGRFLNKVPAQAASKTDLPVQDGKAITAALDRVVMTVKPGDMILFLRRGWTGHLTDPFGFALATVTDIRPDWDETGHAITSLTALPVHSLPGQAQRQDFRILRASKLAHLWLYHQRYAGTANLAAMALNGILAVGEQVLNFFATGGLSLLSARPPSPPEDPRVLAGIAPPKIASSSTSQPILNGAAHLEAITRGINPGDPVLFEKRERGSLGGMFRAQLVKVTGYSEEIWYANPPETGRIGQGPPVGPPGGHGVIGDLLGGGAPAPIPIPHSKITFDMNPILDGMSMDGADLDKIVVHYGWEEVGEQVEQPHTGPTKSVVVPAIPGLDLDARFPVLIRDATGKGKFVLPGPTGTVEGEEDLVPPLEALLHLLPISRGQTVAREILGSGDSILIGQEFVLERSPLTYLADTGPRSVDGYRSTLRIRVDGIEWREVPSFYGVEPDARVFVTREDDGQKTHVRFGDGENGARLPAGRDNVVAQYRYGSGAAVPPVGTLTSILRPQRGLQAIENPIAPGGGAEPDPPEQVRRYAPRSVLTFGRAVSGDDYETVAAQTPGVRRARAYWSWDGGAQRTLVKVFVGDDAAAVTAATAALHAFADPNRPVLVTLAAPVYADLSFTLEVDPAHDRDSVQGAVSAALLDPRNEVFGIDVVEIGHILYDSHIYELCLRTPGVVAVHSLRFGIWTQEFRPLPPSPPIAQPLDLANQAAKQISWNAVELFDPHRRVLGRDWKPSERVDPGGLPVSFTQVDVVRLESGERHSPGEGRFYVLGGDRLHITAETAEATRHAE